MPVFLHQWSYKDEQVKRMISEETDRAEVVRLAVEAFGGTLHSFYYCFGEYDGIAISEFDNNETALACALAITGQGRISRVHTTTLVSAADGLRAMKQANRALRE
jgi:uncharacterized protein with GYD domain